MWKARNPAAIDDFVVDDFLFTTGGTDIVSKDNFKEWATAFMEQIKRSGTFSASRLPRDSNQARNTSIRRVTNATGAGSLAAHAVVVFWVITSEQTRSSVSRVVSIKPGVWSTSRRTLDAMAY